MAFGLARFDIANVTRRLELSEISVNPKTPLTLIFRHAGERNPAWDSWQVKRPKASTALKAGTPEWIAANRAEAAETIANTCVVDWEGVIEDGSPAVFSADAALRFFRELIEKCPDVWARIVSFVINPANFRDAIVDPVDLGKG